MAPPTTTRGAFIVIEGLDRSGKTTQAARLFDRIQSTTTDAAPTPPKAVLLKFPGKEPPPSRSVTFFIDDALFTTPRPPCLTITIDDAYRDP